MNTCIRSNFSAQPCRNWITFPFARSDVQLQKTQVAPYNPTKLAIHSILRSGDDLTSNCGQNLKKIVSFDDIVHSIVEDEENIVNYVDFDCGITFYPETPANIRQINREPNYISRSCEKTKCIPSNDQQNCFIHEQHSFIIFLNPYILTDMVPAALMSLKHTNDRYSMSNQYPQPLTHQPRTDPYPVFSSLRTMDSKGKGLGVRFAFFQRNFLPDWRMNETVAAIEELSDLWKTWARDGVTPFVMNCNYIEVQLSVAVVWFLLFAGVIFVVFLKIFLKSFSLMNSSEK